MASGLYLAVLVVAFSTVLKSAHLPVWIEFVLKASALVAFVLMILVPCVHLFMRLRAQKPSKALTAAGYTMLVGYALFFAWLAYVKLKTCDAAAVPRDESWYCNVEGTHVVAYFALVPVAAAICGGIVGLVLWFMAGKRRAR